MRGDLLTLGALTLLTAGAAARGRGGRNKEQDQEDRFFIEGSYFPDLQDLNKVQLDAMQEGRFVFPDGTDPQAVALFRFDRLPFSRDVRVSPVLTPTVRGPKRTERFVLHSSDPVETDYFDKDIFSGVLELDDGHEFHRYFLPQSQFDLFGE